jgi:hypothetical protein
MTVFINNEHIHCYKHYVHVMPFILSLVLIYFDRLKFCEPNDFVLYFFGNETSRGVSIYYAHQGNYIQISKEGHPHFARNP